MFYCILEECRVLRRGGRQGAVRRWGNRGRRGEHGVGQRRHVSCGGLRTLRAGDRGETGSAASDGGESANVAGVREESANVAEAREENADGAGVREGSGEGGALVRVGGPGQERQARPGRAAWFAERRRVLGRGDR